MSNGCMRNALNTIPSKVSSISEYIRFFFTNAHINTCLLIINMDSSHKNSMDSYHLASTASWSGSILYFQKTGFVKAKVSFPIKAYRS